jgi:multidrug resistance efflux pump
MGRKGITVALAAAVLLIAGIAVIVVVRRNDAREVPQKAAVTTPIQQAPEVILPGRIQSRESVHVPVPVDGVISAFHVEVGAEVYEGQLLAEIRNQQVEAAQELTDLELERAQVRVNGFEGLLAAARLEASRASADSLRARSELERATRNYERQRLLLAEGATPRRTFEKAEAEFKALESESKLLDTMATQSEERVRTTQRDLDAAKKVLEGKLSDLEAAKTRVGAGQVVSPATGIVSARRGQVGDQVNPDVEDLFVIATELSHLEVVVEPDPSILARIKPGSQAGIVLADVPNETLPGTIQDLEGGKVRIEFANPSPLVKPGMTAQVRIPLQQ